MNKVALIAVAKDEDTYIHEWIHHHLYLGFSPIYIGVNRTSDRTQEIINKIKRTEKGVHSFCLDWIDKGHLGLNTRIQNLGYSYLSTKIDQSEVDYVGFLDIDEFWFNIDGKNIQDFIKENNPFDIASFFWLCQFSEDAMFLPPFDNVFYDICGPVKSLVHTKTLDKIRVFTAHVPSYEKNEYLKLIHIDQHGNDISCLNPNKKYNRQLPKFKNKNISNCILHRMMRSEIEYLSLILRGRPNGELIKSTGRHGFKKGKTELPSIFDDEYYTSLNNFISKNDLTDTLNTSRLEKTKYYKNQINSMNSHQLINEIENAIDVLTGTIGLYDYVNAFINKVDDIESLKKFATQLESIDTSLCNQLMRKIKKKD